MICALDKANHAQRKFDHYSICKHLVVPEVLTHFK